MAEISICNCAFYNMQTRLSELLIVCYKIHIFVVLVGQVVHQFWRALSSKNLVYVCMVFHLATAFGAARVTSTTDVFHLTVNLTPSQQLEGCFSVVLLSLHVT